MRRGEITRNEKWESVEYLSREEKRKKKKKYEKGRRDSEELCGKEKRAYFRDRMELVSREGIRKKTENGKRGRNEEKQRTGKKEGRKKNREEKRESKRELGEFLLGLGDDTKLEEAYQCLRKVLHVWLASLSFSTIHIFFFVDLWILFDALIWILDALFHFVDHWLVTNLLLCYLSLIFKLNLGINMKAESSLFLVLENHDYVLLLSSLKSFHLHFQHMDNM